jgi:hypothetical protein
MLDGVLNSESIDTSTSLIGFDAFPRLDHVLTREYLLKQIFSSY